SLLVYLYPLLPSLVLLFCASYSDPRDLHSFPTRRSSDLSAPLTLLSAGAVLWMALQAGAYAAPRSSRQPSRSPVRRARCSRPVRSEEHTSELQSRENLVCRLLLEKKKKNTSSDE